MQEISGLIKQNLHLHLTMTFNEALQFLSATHIDAIQPSIWTDLGCGSGLFTKVLSARLYRDSRIYAIDKSSHVTISSADVQTEIIFQQKDFIKDDLRFYNLHGILMANSLHYVENKKALLQKLRTYLLPAGVFIVIEYDNATANRWVPYPLPFIQLQDLFSEHGYNNIYKTGERKSLYQRGNLYVSLISM